MQRNKFDVLWSTRNKGAANVSSHAEQTGTAQPEAAARTMGNNREVTSKGNGVKAKCHLGPHHWNDCIR
jgi:hypothetical protein